MNKPMMNRMTPHHFRAVAALLIGSLAAPVFSAVDSDQPLTIAVGKAPALDGVLSSDEWSTATRTALPDGSEMLLMQDGANLYVGLRTSHRSVGSICIDRGDRIDVLHSSAALGTARYERAGMEWRLTAPFVWRCRRGPDGVPVKEEQATFLSNEGWLASNALVGSPGHMEYRIAMPTGSLRLAVAFLRVKDRTLLSWPSQPGDGSGNLDLIGGDAPATLPFTPDEWPTAHAEGSAAPDRDTSLDRNEALYLIGTTESDDFTSAVPDRQSRWEIPVLHAPAGKRHWTPLLGEHGKHAGAAFQSQHSPRDPEMKSKRVIVGTFIALQAIGLAAQDVPKQSSTPAAPAGASTSPSFADCRPYMADEVKAHAGDEALNGTYLYLARGGQGRERGVAESIAMLLPGLEPAKGLIIRTKVYEELGHVPHPALHDAITTMGTDLLPQHSGKK